MRSIRRVLKHAVAPTSRLLVLILFGAAPAATQAHAILVDSTPKQDEVVTAAPKEVVLRFNARIEKNVARATLTDGSGQKIKMPPVPEDKDGPPERLIIPLPKLAPGSYRLEYRILASDGHSTPGLVRFKVKAPKVTAPKEKPQEDPLADGPN
jgi:copper resistance protein C